jgi:hypothetical protein
METLHMKEVQVQVEVEQVGQQELVDRPVVPLRKEVHRYLLVEQVEMDPTIKARGKLMEFKQAGKVFSPR